MKVTNANDLQAAINNGETNIVLENNIDATEAIVIPEGKSLVVQWDIIENAVSAYLDNGYRTADIMSEGMKLVGCKECGALITDRLTK